MPHELDEIKKIRKKLGLTQTELANRSGVSQSLIAKIESGRLDPTYTKVKKIENALNDLTRSHEKEARDFMNKNVISINENEKISDIIKIMNKHKISQLPVINNGHVVGLVSESSILSKNLNEIKKLRARDLMDNSPPLISVDTKIEVIRQLLMYYPIVLVKNKETISGLITKADLIKSLV